MRHNQPTASATDELAGIPEATTTPDEQPIGNASDAEPTTDASDAAQDATPDPASPVDADPPQDSEVVPAPEVVEPLAEPAGVGTPIDDDGEKVINGHCVLFEADPDGHRYKVTPKSYTGPSFWAASKEQVERNVPTLLDLELAVEP